MSKSILEIKNQFSQFLVSSSEIKTAAGAPTGIEQFDNFLLWKGLPKGDLTLFSSRPGVGATSVWLNAAKMAQSNGKWAAWINSDWELLPMNLQQKNLDLRKLLVVKKPTEANQFFWMIQELISSQLFEIIGCHLTEGIFKWHQLKKLKKLARLHQVALVLISHAPQWKKHPLFALSIEFQKDFITILRAQHRLTPFTISGGSLYARFMPQLTTKHGCLLF